MKIDNKLTIIVNHYKKLLERNESLGTVIAQLTALGCIDAKEYWKDGKYLYLLRSMKNGKRIKTYVGNHPLRIEEARTKVRNYKKRLQIIHTQEVVMKETFDIEAMIKRCLALCSNSNMSALFALEGINMGTKTINAGADLDGMCTQKKHQLT